MGTRVLTVLRASKDFQPQHVQAMQRQLARHAPDAELLCLSDVDVPGVRCAQLKYGWTDWWSKMEVFRPEIKGDLLLTDLDNIFVGPLNDILSVSEYTTQVGESNALAYYTEEVRARIWENWMRDPKGHMRIWNPKDTPNPGQFGDGGFIKSLMHAGQHWEELFPDQVTNIAKIGITSGGIPAPFTFNRKAAIGLDTRVLLCWRPWRPWKVPTLRPYGMYE